MEQVLRRRGWHRGDDMPRPPGLRAYSIFLSCVIVLLTVNCCSGPAMPRRGRTKKDLRCFRSIIGAESMNHIKDTPVQGLFYLDETVKKARTPASHTALIR